MGRACAAVWLASAFWLGGACSGRVAAPSSPAAGPRITERAEAPAPAWVQDLERELAALRGLAFTRPVPFAAQTRAQFHTKVRAELTRELPAAKATGLSRAYASLGFVPPGFDLSHAMEEAFTSEVLAYYEPETRAFRVIGDEPVGPQGKGATEVVAHELVHALQDQHFDLQRFGAEHDDTVDDDQKLARRFVVEGEATFLMMAHGLARAGSQQTLGNWSVAGLRVWTRMLAAMDLLDVASTVRLGREADSLSADDRAALTAVADLPPIVTVPMFEPYFKGAELISEVWAAGGWPAVDALYRRPPESTEQALHPADKLMARRDRPVKVTLEGPTGWSPADARLQASEVIGELGWRTYFKTWHLDGAEEAAEGWGGDRYWSWAIGDRTVTVTATTWDTPADAERFCAGYETTLASRYPRGVPSRWDAGGLRLDTPAGPVMAIRRKGNDVDMIQGMLAAELEGATRLLNAVHRVRPPQEQP